MAKDMMQTANARESVVGAVQANDHSQIIEIMKMQQDQQTKFHDTLFQMQQGQIAELKATLANNQSNSTMLQVGTSQPKSLIEQINEMKAVKDTMREVLGLGDEVAEKGSWWQDNMPMIVQGLSVLGSVISTGLYNLAVIKSGQGAPQVPPGPEAVLTEEQQDEMRARGIPVGGHPPMNQQAPPQQQAGGQPTMEGGDMFAQYHAFLGMIKIPILKSFQDGESGDEFAEKLMLLGDNGHFGENLQGRQVYDMVVSNGKPTIMALIKTYPPIWNVVQLTPAKWEKFMTDFFDAERLLKEKWDEEERDSAAGADEQPAN